MNDESYGKVAYDAYCMASEGKSLVSGVELPPWIDLPESIQAAWTQAAKAVREVE